jgi:hypothetical protein
MTDLADDDAPAGRRRNAHKSSKLHENDIPVIRSGLSNGVSMAELARQFRVNERVISLIRDNKIWVRA